MTRRLFVWSVLCLFLAGPVFAGDTSRYDDVFRKYSKRWFGVGFDWRVFKAQGLAESNLNPAAHSWVGAIGIMQLMPSTFKEVQSRNPELSNMNDPEWNIAAGVYYDRQLWKQWTRNESAPDRLSFVFGSYNAGRGIILKAQNQAAKEQLDQEVWPSIEQVAPQVPRWRHQETLGYVRKIEGFYIDLSGTGGFNDFLGK